MSLEPWQQSHLNRYELRQLVHSHLKRSVKPVTPSAYRRDDFPDVAQLVTDRPEVHERCWQRICPSCAKAIAQRLRDRYAGRITKVMLEAVPSWTLKMLTLTAKREDDLAAQIGKIHKATKKLIRHFWTSKDKRSGAFATFEIGPKGGNVHVHCIVYGCYVGQEEISNHWRELTGNYIADIRRIDPGRAVTEGIKYITKFAKGENGEADWILTSEDLVTLHFALKGKRRAWSWGRFMASVTKARKTAQTTKRRG